MRKQNTLRNSVTFKGVGIHSGSESRITLHPAPEDTGIVFIRKGNSVNEYIPYDVSFITDTRNNISVSNGREVVKTVEHLTAALYGLQVDNCLIECTSSEIPIMDGSAREFVEGIKNAGVREQDKVKEEFRIISPVWVTHEDKYLVALPFDGFKISYTISFPNSPIGTQNYQSEIEPERFENDLSAARTFGFVEDLEIYQESGLSLGVSLDNVHAFSRRENRCVNGSRYNEEPVRHKTVDLMGALAMMKYDLKGFLISYKGGHTLDVLFLNKLVSQASAGLRAGRPAEVKNNTGYYYHLADLLGLSKLPS